MCNTRRLPDGIRVFKSPHSVTVPVSTRPSTNVFDTLRFTSETNVSHLKQASPKSAKGAGGTKSSLRTGPKIYKPKSPSSASQTPVAKSKDQKPLQK